MDTKMKWPAGLVLFILVVLVGAPYGSAQDVVWVTAEGTAPLAAGGTKKARVQAIASAERRAIATALAPTVSVETMLVNLRLSGSIVGSIPFGKVAQKKIIEEGKFKAKDAVSGRKGRFYRVKIKAGVVKETGSEDPAFYLDASINQSVFKDGDELEIGIRSTKDCYFAIFNILENNKIIRLFPNFLTAKNFLSTNKRYTFPGKQGRKKGLRLQLHLPKNKESVTESIYILALLHPFKLESVKAQEGIFGVYNGQTVFMKDLIQEVVAIPLANRAEVLMQYEIRKTTRGI